MNSEIISLIESVIEELYGEKVSYVTGAGSFDAPVMLVGEAPGRFEIEQGVPFVGQAGKNLDLFLEGADLSREKMYVTNAVKIRPTKEGKTKNKVNRPPTRKEILAFNKVLSYEIALIKPKIIVTLGNTPLFSLIGRNDISACHGTMIDHNGIKLFPMFHPAALIYNRALAPEFEKDMAKLAQTIDEMGINTRF